MPTIFSHALAASAAAQWWPGRLPARFWTWTAICAMLPDIDVIAFAFGIPYGDMFGHRGFTHSLFFAAVVGALLAMHVSHLTHPSHRSHPSHLSHRSHRSHRSHQCALFIWFTALTASHGILDALTNGGRGIAFFAPFSDYRYFFPWQPIQVSPIGVGFFSARGLRVLASEAGWIWVPSAIIAASARLFRNGQT
jgi:inner membrane protein